MTSQITMISQLSDDNNTNQYVPEIQDNIYANDSDHVLLLIDSIYSRLKLVQKNGILVLPIKKIKNICVEVYISKISKKEYTLSIVPTVFSVAGDTLFEQLFERQITDESDEKFIRRCITHILHIIKNININKLHGCFDIAANLQTQTQQDAFLLQFHHEFKDDENIVLTINECCVCFSMTETTTNCGHLVCLECISKLLNDSEENWRYKNHKKCPMCRQRINYLH